MVASEPTDTEKQADITKWGTKNVLYTVNPDSPFCREYIGDFSKVVSDDNIYSDQLALERSEFELWQYGRQVYYLTLNSMYVPFLYGNEKIAYKLKPNNEYKEWIIKKINGSWIDGTMTINLTEFYPYYPHVVKDEDDKGSE